MKGKIRNRNLVEMTRYQFIKAQVVLEFLIEINKKSKKVFNFHKKVTNKF